MALVQPASAGTANKNQATSWLSDWPLERPTRWVDLVNEGLTEAELAALQNAVRRGLPVRGGVVVGTRSCGVSGLRRRRWSRDGEGATGS